MEGLAKWWRRVTGQQRIEDLQYRQLKVLELLVSYVQRLNDKVDKLSETPDDQLLRQIEEALAPPPTVDEIVTRHGHGGTGALARMTEAVGEEAARSVRRFER